MTRIVACRGGAAQQEVGFYDGFRHVSHLTRDPLGRSNPPGRGTTGVFYWVTKYTLGIDLKIVFRPWSRA